MMCYCVDGVYEEKPKLKYGLGVCRMKWGPRGVIWSDCRQQEPTMASDSFRINATDSSCSESRDLTATRLKNEGLVKFKNTSNFGV